MGLKTKVIQDLYNPKQLEGHTQTEIERDHHLRQVWYCKVKQPIIIKKLNKMYLNKWHVKLTLENWSEFLKINGHKKEIYNALIKLLHGTTVTDKQIAYWLETSEGYIQTLRYEAQKDGILKKTRIKKSWHYMTTIIQENFEKAKFWIERHPRSINWFNKWKENKNSIFYFNCNNSIINWDDESDESNWDS